MNENSEPTQPGDAGDGEEVRPIKGEEETGGEQNFPHRFEGGSKIPAYATTPAPPVDRRKMMLGDDSLPPKEDWNKIELIYTFEIPTTAQPRDPGGLTTLLNFWKKEPRWPMSYLKNMRARFMGTPHCERMEITHVPDAAKFGGDSPVVENIALRGLLLQFVQRYAPANKPGAWEYDKEVVKLIEDAAKILKIDPWK
jgi:hypothetical protein